MSEALHSALYNGRLRHRRHAPRSHAFDMPLTMTWLDLDELDRVFDGRWLWSARGPNLQWFRRADYLTPDIPDLAEAVRRRVRETGRPVPDGPVRMLAQLRSFGHCFNPVTFYYCYRADGATLDTIVAEITNTPWGERHQYVLPVPPDGAGEEWVDFQFGKDFHVSPFMPMALDYRWRFSLPGEALRVHMDLRRGSEHLFDATLILERAEMNGVNMARALVRHPAMSLQVVLRIHWEALRLWCKRVPVHPHPAKTAGRHS